MTGLLAYDNGQYDQQQSLADFIMVRCGSLSCQGGVKATSRSLRPHQSVAKGTCTFLTWPKSPDNENRMKGQCVETLTLQVSIKRDKQTPPLLHRSKCRLSLCRHWNWNSSLVYTYQYRKVGFRTIKIFEPTFFVGLIIYRLSQKKCIEYNWRLF